MMDWTDRHCRFFLRLLAPSAMLYTEMVTAAAIEYGDVHHLLQFDESEHPLALQLGGSEPLQMAAATRKAVSYAYDEININVGCPSDRVRSGQFGACLMARPDVVAECFRAMSEQSDIPITVKTRIGIDDQDSFDFLRRFVDTLAGAGCRKFVVHARIALLDGLSPKQNRSVPPLNYERVYRLKRHYPDLDIVINGGFVSIEQVDDALRLVDGVMIGRQAYQQPFFLAELEQHLDAAYQLPERREIVMKMIAYAESVVANGEPLARVTRHMLGLFAGQPGARAWRRYISEHAHVEHAQPSVLLRALRAVPSAA
jgi:tRNA-dihydrouridine synthase A